MTDLPELWEAARRHLEAARGQLTNPHDPELALYREFLDHNELGLGLDELVDVAQAQRAPDAVWRSLSAAARTMGIEPDDTVHGATVQRIADHLTAGHDARGLQRMLNAWDPIGVAGPGGPDDEYSCLYGPLLRRLGDGQQAPDISAFLRAELEDHFGIGADHARTDAFAQRLVGWFADGAAAEGDVGWH